MTDLRCIARTALLAAVSALTLALSAGAAATQAAAASPTCASGPERIGHTIVGTPCSDVIYAPASVTTVNGGAGNDTIIATETAATAECPEPGCRLGVGSQTFEGGPGNDVVFGERGNDILRGGEGNDRLYGGIGDDLLEGGPGNDLLAGGFGADGIDGGPGNDLVRGDGTQDEIVDTGPASDVDTLSYATGVTPGFGNATGYPNFGAHAGFPPAASERGVYLNLAGNLGDNGVAPNGGGVDTVEGSDFERIIGSPFADYIVGASATQEIIGGAGGDVLIAGASGAKLKGGVGGDDCVGGEAVSGCETSEANGPVQQRDPSKVSVGQMAPGEAEIGPGGPSYTELYLLGSTAGDHVVASYVGGSPASVKLEVSGGEFGGAPSTEAGCEVKSMTEAVCPLEGSLDSLLIAGLGSNDSLSVSQLPATTSLMMLGGDGNDVINGGEESDDTLVDGPGEDRLFGHNGDDAVLNNAGRDEVFGEGGNDLFLSNAICEGDVINGGEGRDNASWAKFKNPAGDESGQGVEARLDTGQAGRPGPEGTPVCPPEGALDRVEAIEDLEGSGLADTFYGDAGPNQLLGHFGPDTYFAGGGDDSILANSGDFDPVIDCGEGTDSAVIDRPQYGDIAAEDCENVFEADPNNFRALTRLRPAIAPEPPPPPPDVTPPQTRITVHPSHTILLSRHKKTRRVSFRFTSSEPLSRFRCKIDGRPFRACVPPAVYRVRLGRHAFRAVAIDASGNVDPTAAIFRFRVRSRR